ncbi:hypothetical protein BGW39_008218 [Mortierella sp. 14UC]|nr:hypothetical protein BGW39_008218 [Mortierella sp. 14UC]
MLACVIRTALLSGAEGKPQRIYGRDSTVDDLWPPLPPPTRVVPIDAPNEKRPFQFNGSSMLPPVLPLPTSSAPSSSSSSSILPYPSGFSSGSMEQKPRRIYGIDAADAPARFPAPPALPSSYGPNGNHYSKRQDTLDEIESGESRKRVFGRDSSDSYQKRPYGSSAAAPPASSAPSYGSSQPYGYNAPPPPPPPQSSAPQSHHYASSDMDRSSRYDEYKHRGWSNGQPSSSSSSMGHGGPSYGTPTSRPYSRAQSPTMDIKPPSWYQDYANSVPPKPQTQPAYQQRSDSGYYGGGGNSQHYQQQQQHHHHHHHHHSSSHGYGGSSSLSGIHEMDENEEGHHHHHSSTKSSGSKRSHKSEHGSSPSVHPFDTMDPSANSSKSKKPKRIKNAAGQEDMIVMDDEFYAVKAKRKRANASQLSVLNAAFERSYFPSTEERLRLSKQCRMCPRTVQIWFQNKRQSVKARSEAMEAAVSGTAVTDELLEQRLQMLEEEQNLGSMDGQKRSTGDMADEDYDDEEESGPGEPHGGDKSSHHRHHHGGSGSGSSSKQRRSSGNNPGASNASSNGTGLPTPSDAVMSALHIQLDGRSVDYFSRKRRATIAKMERNEQQKKEKEELQRKREQEQQQIIQQYQKHQQEQVQKQRLQQQQQQQQQEGQTVGQN